MNSTSHPPAGQWIGPEVEPAIKNTSIPIHEQEQHLSGRSHNTLPPDQHSHHHHQLHDHPPTDDLRQLGVAAGLETTSELRHDLSAVFGGLHNHASNTPSVLQHSTPPVHPQHTPALTSLNPNHTPLCIDRSEFSTSHPEQLLSGVSLSEDGRLFPSDADKPQLRQRSQRSAFPGLHAGTRTHVESFSEEVHAAPSLAAMQLPVGGGETQSGTAEPYQTAEQQLEDLLLFGSETGGGGTMRRGQEPTPEPPTVSATAAASTAGAVKQEGGDPPAGTDKVVPTENNAAADRKSEEKESLMDDHLPWYRRRLYMRIVIPVTMTILLLIVAGGLQAVSRRFYGELARNHDAK